MTLGRKIALLVAAVLVVGTVGPYLLMTHSSHTAGVHIVK